jgi:hypothetical protein
MQKLLGKVSDAYTVSELLAGQGGYKKELDREGKKRIAEFREFWKDRFDAPGERRTWIGLLGGAAPQVNGNAAPENEVS